MSAPQYRTTFAAQIRAIEPTEREVNEVKASLTNLKTLLPPGIDPDEDYDLLYIAADLAVAGLVNLNDDGVDLETGLAIYPQFERRFCDIEHERDRICGYILRSALTEFGTDRVITEDEARAANKPFNIATVAVLWRAVSPELCAYIEEASTPTHPDYKDLSLSFELGFTGYRIIGLPEGDRTIANAKVVIHSTSIDFDSYDKRLRYKGGSGVMPQDAKGRLYRVLDQGAKPLGQGVVSVPAAAVKGIAAITEKPVPEAPAPAKADDDAYAQPAVDQLDEACPVDLMKGEVVREWSNCFAAKLESALARINSRESRVSPSTLPFLPMTKQDIQSFKDKIAKASKLEEVVAGTNDLLDAISAEADRLAAAKLEADAQAANILRNKQEAEAAAAALTESLKTVQAELAALKSAQAATEAAAKFQERMTSLEGIFALENDAETRAYLVEEVKSCATDEAFAAKVDKLKKVMKEKTKDFKKKQDDDSKAAIASKLEAAQAVLAGRGIKTKLTNDVLDIEEVLASAVANPTSAALPNTAEDAKSIKEQAEAAFRSSLTVQGKKLAEIASK